MTSTVRLKSLRTDFQRQKISTKPQIFFFKTTVIRKCSYFELKSEFFGLRLKIENGTESFLLYSTLSHFIKRQEKYNCGR